MIKKLSKLILIAFLSFNLGIAITAVSYLAYTKYLLPNTVKYTYIKDIIGSPQDRLRVMLALYIFNSMSNSKNIIKYAKPDSIFARGITISVRKPILPSEFGLVGITYPFYANPTVSILAYYSEKDFMETTLHELLHVYGVGHTNDKCDLMYKATSYCISDDNIKKYALILDKQL